MKLIKMTGKIILAGIAAVAVVSLLLFAYQITPVHAKNVNGNTDYVWPANAIWVKMTEGTSFGRLDENGYNNVAVVENPDIIILGSSHTEAMNVMQDENAAYLLGRKLDGKYTVYNMGISGHNFVKICQYLPKNEELFESAPKVTILETASVQINAQNVEDILNGSVEREQSFNNGLIGRLQKIPFCRMIYQQMKKGLLDLFMPPRTGNENTNDVKKNENATDADAYERLFSYLQDVESKYDTQIIVFYHPFESFQADGSIAFKGNSQNEKIFSEKAQEHNITFVNMKSAFEKMYESQNHVAHGFATGELGTGHLNKYGHAAISEELYKAILALEEDGLLCK